MRMNQKTGQSGDQSHPSNTKLFDWELSLEDGDDGDKFGGRDTFEPMPFDLEEDNGGGGGGGSGGTLFQDESGGATRDEAHSDHDGGDPSCSHPSHEMEGIGGRSSCSSVDSSVGGKRKGEILRRKKKSKGMPKRPLSAYNIFFQKERVKIIDTGGEDVGGFGRNLAFEDLGKIIGKRWRSLSASERQSYEDLAEKDSLRYRKEMEMFSVEKRKRNSSDDNHESLNRSVSNSLSRSPLSQPLSLSENESSSQCQSRGMQLQPPWEPEEAGSGESAPGSPRSRAIPKPPPSAEHFSQLNAQRRPGGDGPYQAFSGCVTTTADHQWMFPPPPSGVVPIAAGPPLPMNVAPNGVGEGNSSICPIPPGMELLLPDRENRKRKFKVQYSCYSMSLQAAHRYIESLTGAAASSPFSTHANPPHPPHPSLAHPSLAHPPHPSHPSHCHPPHSPHPPRPHPLHPSHPAQPPHPSHPPLSPHTSHPTHHSHPPPHLSHLSRPPHAVEGLHAMDGAYAGPAPPPHIAQTRDEISPSVGHAGPPQPPLLPRISSRGFRGSWSSV